MSGKPARNGFGLNYSNHGKPAPQQVPRTPAHDPEYELSQPITREERRIMLRRHFEEGGLTEAEIEEHMRNAKV
jgi:hypothetical protein